MGPNTYHILEQTGTTDMDEIPPVGHIKRRENKNILFTAPKITLCPKAC